MTNISEVVVSIGIDLGDRTAAYACLDDEGRFVEEGSVEMDPQAFRRQFACFEATKVAFEAGGQSRWVEQVLRDIGHHVIVANPRQLKLITASDHKNDANDARLLARIARVDPSLLNPVEHRSDEHQVTLVGIRVRAQLVKMRTAAMHSLRGMAKSFGVRLPRASSENFLERCRQAVPEQLRPAMNGLFEIVAELTRQIAACDEQIEQKARREYPEVERLSGIYGVGTLTGLTFVATLADAGRFAKSRDVGPYLGLTPRQRQSGKQDPQLRITKAGDVYLRSMLVQCAHTVMRKNAPLTALRKWGMKLCERGGKNAKKRAIVGVARKLAVLLHRMWVTGEQYRPFPTY
jgi:transposase